MEIVRMTDGDGERVAAAAHLFDGAPDTQATERFLRSDGHHLLVAYVDGKAAGFASGVELTHPDKGTELLVYELGVDEAFRRTGIGRALVRALRELAHERGCYGMFVLTEPDNEPALALYDSSGGRREEVVLFEWKAATS
jgi:ribosomal protein S18 acetylase RimI-like enzyme